MLEYYVIFHSPITGDVIKIGSPDQVDNTTIVLKSISVQQDFFNPLNHRATINIANAFNDSIGLFVGNIVEIYLRDLSKLEEPIDISVTKKRSILVPVERRIFLGVVDTPHGYLTSNGRTISLDCCSVLTQMLNQSFYSGDQGSFVLRLGNNEIASSLMANGHAKFSDILKYIQTNTIYQYILDKKLFQVSTQVYSGEKTAWSNVGPGILSDDTDVFLYPGVTATKWDVLKDILRIFQCIIFQDSVTGSIIITKPSLIPLSEIKTYLKPDNEVMNQYYLIDQSIGDFELIEPYDNGITLHLNSNRVYNEIYNSAIGLPGKLPTENNSESENQLYHRVTIKDYVNFLNTNNSFSTMIKLYDTGYFTYTSNTTDGVIENMVNNPSYLQLVAPISSKKLKTLDYTQDIDKNRSYFLYHLTLMRFAENLFEEFKSEVSLPLALVYDKILVGGDIYVNYINYDQFGLDTPLYYVSNYRIDANTEFGYKVTLSLTKQQTYVYDWLTKSQGE